MIYITGDTHADFGRLYQLRAFNKHLTKDDYVIICGDFGGVWNGSPQENHQLDKLEKFPFTLLFVCGNHENFDRLYQYPLKQWHGGYVHEIRPHILHLDRGYVFDIDGYKVFAMGGARSHDISDGILDPSDPNFNRRKKRLDSLNGMYRILGKSWWAEEVPNSEEYARAIHSLEAVDWKVDFIISHEGPTSAVSLLYNGNTEEYALMNFLQEIDDKCQYKKWFFGHHHVDRKLDEKHQTLYRCITEVI